MSVAPSVVSGVGGVATVYRCLRMVEAIIVRLYVWVV